MKHLIFLLFLLTIQLLQSQNKTLKEKLSHPTAKATDTIFRLHSGNSIAELPATLISGGQEGPTFTIAAGINGMGHQSVLSLLKLRKEIRPEMLKGNIIILPIMNIKPFYDNSSSRNLILNTNQFVSELPADSIRDIITDFITTEIFDATDVFLEVHSGNANDDLLAHMSYYDNKDFAVQTELVSHLCEVSGLNTTVSYPYKASPCQLKKCCVKQAVKLGIPAFKLQTGKITNDQKSPVLIARAALYRILAELKMYDNKKIKNVKTQKTKYSRQAYILSPAQGLFYSSYKAGRKIIKDEEIGYITDVFGKNVKIITAPYTGKILYKTRTLPVNKEQTLFYIGY